MQPDTIPDELLNLERLARWLDDQGLRPGAAISAAPLAGGASNAMFAVHRGDANWVLRRPAGLGTLGRPDGFHERQVERWTSQLNSYGADRLPGVPEVTSWLQKRIPARFEPALMHGDYHMLNVLLRFDDGPEVVAIIDWETTTIGDPLLDLAGFIETWTRRGQHTTGDEAAAIVSEYLLSRSKAHESLDLTYYKVLYNFRLAVLLEGVYQRSLKDPTVVPKVQAAQEALNNLSRAVELIREDTHGTAAGTPA
jgi:aminoglycoside phosphotransferase (APT) family kinase protein